MPFAFTLISLISFFSFKRQDVLLDNIEGIEDLELRDSMLPVRDMSNWTISIPKVAFNHHGSKEVIVLPLNVFLRNNNSDF